MNVTDGKFYTKTSGGVVKEVGWCRCSYTKLCNNSGASSNNDITLDGANLIFEGYQANAFETTLTALALQEIIRLTLPQRHFSNGW